MPKKESEKQWQQDNPDKVKQYMQAYMKDKTSTTVVLEAWVLSEIDKVKQPGQKYGNWVRQMVEKWALNQRQQ